MYADAKFLHCLLCMLGMYNIGSQAAHLQQCREYIIPNRLLPHPNIIRVWHFFIDRTLSEMEESDLGIPYSYEII